MSDPPSGWITVLLRLPLLYNPDPTGARAPVENEKFLQTADEIAQQFGGGTLFMFRSNAPRGFWWDRGIMDQDTLALIEVDVPDTGASRAWLRAYARDVLLGRFQQRAIYLKFVRPIEQLIISEEEVDDEG
jgi:hypothetical protein